MIKKRVLLIVNSDMVNAGVPNVVMTLVRNLSDRFSFDVVTYHNGEGQYDSEFESLGGQIFRLSLLDYNRHKILYPLRCFQIRSFLKDVLSQNKYDIIHCHNGIEAGIFLKCAALEGIRCRVAHAHGTYYRKGSNIILLWYQSFCKKQILKNATTQLACSTKAGESLFVSGTFINVMNPVDISPYRGLTKKAHEGCNLLQIGYFCENKNQLFSIKLLKSLLDENIDVCLKIIGFSQDGEYYAKMLKFIDQLSVSERICFLPPNIDKAEVFADTDVVLLPSFTEGLPLVALEAQSAGVETLLSDRISTDANLGLATYAEYNNLSEWKSAVKQIYSRRESFDKININTDLIEMNKWCERIEAVYDGR